MNCRQSSEYMMKHFDGITNDIESAQFKLHLKTCQKCAEEFESLQSVLSMLESEVAPEPPDGIELAVMAKVNAFEEEKKKKAAKWLVMLYNATTAVSMVLLLLYVANLKDINVISGINGIGEYFNSFSSVVSGLYGLAAGIYGLVLNAIGIIFQVFVTLVKNYYYVFGILLVLLMGVQKLFFVLVDQGGRETR